MKPAPGDPKRASGDELLARGLTACCRALDGPEYEFAGGQSPPWFMAHFGLAVMAGVWLTREFDLDDATIEAIGGQCEAVIGAFPVLFEPLDLEAGPADAGRINELVATLRPGLARYKRSGHNATYAAYLIKVLGEHPEWTTPGVMDRVLDLIATVNGPPEREDAAVPSIAEAPAYGVIEDVAGAVLRDMDALDFADFETWKIMIGHVLTHGHGLLELDRMGYGALARLGFDAHRAHAYTARSNRSSTDRMRKVVHGKDPLSADFWSGDVRTDRDWEVGHTFKYTYSLHRTLAWVEDKALCARAARQLWYMV